MVVARGQGLLCRRGILPRYEAARCRFYCYGSLALAAVAGIVGLGLATLAPPVTGVMYVEKIWENSPSSEANTSLKAGAKRERISYWAKCRILAKPCTALA